MSNSVVQTSNVLSIADLRDYAMPDAIGLLPLSTGARVFILALLCGLAAWGWVLIRRWRQRAYRRAGATKLLLLNPERPSTPLTEHEIRTMAHDISVILKRVALAAWSREDVAPLTGPAWTRFLQSTLPGREMPDGVAMLLDGTQGTETGSKLPEALESLFDYAGLWVGGHRR